MTQKEENTSYRPVSRARELSMADAKKPPNATDFERLVIGGILIDNNKIDDLWDMLFPEIFYDPRHQEIYRAVVQLRQRGEPVDIVTLIQELKRTDKLNLCGGEQYIIDLSLSVSSSANIDYYGRIVIEKYILRSLIDISAKVIDEAYMESADVFELLDKSEKAFFDITNDTLKKNFHSASDLVKEALEKIKSISQKEGVSGVPSGFKKLDMMTGGWQDSDLIIIAARPAMGKTAFLLSMARNMCIEYNMPLAIFSLEMSSVQLITRMIAAETGINSEALRKGNLTEEQWKILYNNISKLENAPLYIDETPALSVFDFRAKCRRLVVQHGVKIIMVDYLQLMTANNGQKSSGNREQEIATISRSLKAIAKELNVPVIALSQLSRSVENRPGKRPQLSDLRESGAIEQDADIVSFIFRPEYYGIDYWDNDPGPEQNATKNQAELIIAKHRNGGTGEVRLAFLNELAKFTNLEDLSYGYGPMDMSSAADDAGLKALISGRDPSESFPMHDASISGSSMNDDDEVPF